MVFIGELDCLSAKGFEWRGERGVGDLREGNISMPKEHLSDSVSQAELV